jgi:hypothetical protein
MNMVVAYYERFVSYVQNISAKDRALALVWYPRTAAPVIHEGAAHGLSAYQSVAVFAALSANARLTQNWALFRQFCATGIAATMPVALNGALRAVTVDGPASIDAITMPGSKHHKTKCFARAQVASLGHAMGVSATHPTLACCDRWIHRAGTGDMDVISPPPGKKYLDMAQALSLLAVDARLPVWSVQAMVWAAVQTAQGIDWLATDSNLLAYRTPPTVHIPCPIHHR